MMRNVFRQTFAALLLCAALPLAAATPNAFYANLLRRGIGAFDAGRFEEAVGELRLAAFGSVESIESYETAQVYLTISYDRLAQPDRAREAARKIIAAERVERRYTALGIPAAVRTSFEPLAAKLLTPAEMNTLRGGPPPPATSPLKLQPATATPPKSVPAKPAGTTTTITVPMPVTEAPKPAAANPPPVSTVPPATQQQTPARTQVQTPTQTPTQTPKPTPTQTPAQTPKPAATTTATPPRQVQTPPKTAATPPRTTTEPPKQAVTTPAQMPAQTAAKPPATVPPPAAQTTKPAPAPVTVPKLTAAEVASRLTAGERALTAANLTEARRIYRELLAAQGVDHDALLRVAEGFYRARDFAGALSAFQRLGPLRRGEEPYRYYVAVALYETGAYAEAKRELNAVLPFIEVTPDVQRYRSRIEGAVN